MAKKNTPYLCVFWSEADLGIENYAWGENLDAVSKSCTETEAGHVKTKTLIVKYYKDMIHIFGLLDEWFSLLDIRPVMKTRDNRPLTSWGRGVTWLSVFLVCTFLSSSQFVGDGGGFQWIF